MKDKTQTNKYNTLLSFIEKNNKGKNKKHSKNADTSTSLTFDLVVWPWPFVKVKKADVIRCRLLYCTLVPGMMSVSVIICEIWPLVHFCDLWPSPVTFIVRQGHFHFYHQCCCVLVPSTKCVGSIKFEIWTIVLKKLKWRHNDVITHEPNDRHTDR